MKQHIRTKYATHGAAKKSLATHTAGGCTHAALLIVMFQPSPSPSPACCCDCKAYAAAAAQHRHATTAKHCCWALLTHAPAMPASCRCLLCQAPDLVPCCCKRHGQNRRGRLQRLHRPLAAHVPHLIARNSMPYDTHSGTEGHPDVILMKDTTSQGHKPTL